MDIKQEIAKVAALKNEQVRIIQKADADRQNALQEVLRLDGELRLLMRLDKQVEKDAGK